MLDPILHQPIRTRMVAYLVARQEATFVDIKEVVGITDGNLAAHMKKLFAAGYVVARREEQDGRSQTLYAITEAGTKAFKDYVKVLQSIIAVTPARTR